jgi:arylformamidase
MFTSPGICRGLSSSLCTIVLLLSWHASFAAPILDSIGERRSAQLQDTGLEENTSSGHLSLPAGVRLLRDVPYGSDDRQRMDIYLPQHAVGAPVIFMVHGGAWRLGDKSSPAVIENKVARWVPKGFIFVSTNYRLLPKTAPLQQAEDIARALATAQGKAISWGGDPSKFILMGHSAGAHLAALLGASPMMAFKLGAAPWLGTILLDSAALDVVKIMQTKHARFYDYAFGSNATFWLSVSPIHLLSSTATPLLAVCSVQRDDSCPQTSRFIAKALSLGIRAQALEQNLSHRDINQQLGNNRTYTEAVESFMSTLDEKAMQALTSHPMGTR